MGQKRAFFQGLSIFGGLVSEKMGSVREPQAL